MIGTANLAPESDTAWPVVSANDPELAELMDTDGPIWVSDSTPDSHVEDLYTDREHRGFVVEYLRDGGGFDARVFDDSHFAIASRPLTPERLDSFSEAVSLLLRTLQL